MTTITVIIPTHNRSYLLNKTLASLARQINDDFTVFVVDHGSEEDIKQVCQQYTQTLSLEYYRLPKSKDAPGAPRHFAMRHVKTPLVVFLDCGIVVPSFYVSAHLAFHQKYHHHVGIGYYHGLNTKEDQDDRWSVILDKVSIDDAESVLVDQPDLADERKKLDLPAAFDWMYGWTGNLSLHTQDYWSTGGFDPELGYANEDVELSYRLLKQGVQFAVVENGWAVHLPHSRQPLKIRRRNQYIAWQYCYRKLRTLAIEIILFAGLFPKGITQAFRYLSELGGYYPLLPSTRSLAAHHQFPRPSLLIGGTTRDASHYDYVALADENIASTDALWSCAGLRIPLDDHALKSVVVSDVWKWLGLLSDGPRTSPLECMIADIRRTAPMAFFVDTPEATLPIPQNVSRTDLEQLCRKYDLPFQIIVPQSVPTFR